jgi:hypothetical protein
MTFAYRFICGFNVGLEFGGSDEDFVFSPHLGILELALLREE